MRDDSFRKRLKRREDMFLRRLFVILAKMAKANGKVDAWEVHAAEGAFARFSRVAARRTFCRGVWREWPAEPECLRRRRMPSPCLFHRDARGRGRAGNHLTRRLLRNEVL